MTNNEKLIKYLAVGEFGCGTKVYEPLATDGLAFFLEKNNLGKDLDMVLINGGIVPYIPRELTPQNAREMSFVGNDLLKEEDSPQELLNNFKDKKSEEYFEKNIKKKITSLEDALNVARREIKKLLDVVPNAPFHYIPGEEDVKHIADAEKLLIKLSFDKPKFEEQKDKLEKKTNKINIDLNWLRTEYDLLKKLNEDSSGNTLEDCVKKFCLEQADNIKKLPKEAEIAFVDYVQALYGKKAKKNLSDKLALLEKEVKKNEEHFESSKRELCEAENRLAEVKNKLAHMGVTRFTGRYSLTTVERELFFYKAKKQYQNALLSIDPNKRFIPHAKFQRDFDEKKLKNPGKSENIENEIYLKPGQINTKGLRFIVFHNVSFRSDNLSKKSIPELQKHNHLRNLTNLPVGDILIATHGATGFEHMPAPKYRESTLENEAEPQREIVDYLHLPTFHDPQKLLDCEQKRIRNWHTKRWDEKIFASGAVIHTRYKDGRDVVEFIPFEQLVVFGKLKQEIDAKLAELKSTKDKEERKKYKKEIKTFEEKIKLNLTKVEYTSDTHLGAPNTPGKLSNYQLVDLVQEYQRSTKLPDILWFGGDNLHGILDRTFNSNGEYLSDVPFKTKGRTEQILNNPLLSDKEKSVILAQLTLEIQAGIPITHMSKQLEQFKWCFTPYIEEILEKRKQSHIVFVSGNHYNGTSKKWDESRDLSLLLPLEYHEEKRVHIYDDPGAENGSGGLRIGNKTFYAMHHFKKGSSDVIYGAMKHLLDAAMKYDHVSFGHWHVPMAGYSNGSFITACTTMQPPHKFEDTVGVVPSLRGITNFYYDDNKKYGRWEYVLDHFLESLSKKKK
ncbi:hypothetical protein HYV79_04620 [Candidatus Woesearchaeota archaeon]|nr:hypothetical protein [Candidatus Woesearchaeota archaeon]